MPIYEFICIECGNEFERLVRKSSENNEIRCPKCHGSNLEEKVSSFASVSNNGGSRASTCTPSGG